jgi:transcriptional regulator with XRE-family HTH domain
VGDPGDFGRRLKTLREQRKLSQSKLGKAAGLHRQTIAKLERGERGERTSGETLQRLAMALDVPLHRLTGSETGEVINIDEALAAYPGSRQAGFGKPPSAEELRYLQAHPSPAWAFQPPGPEAIWHALESLRSLQNWPELLASWVAANPAAGAVSDGQRKVPPADGSPPASRP